MSTANAPTPSVNTERGDLELKGSSSQQDHFDTTEVNKDLSRRAVRGGVATVLFQGIGFSIKLISTYFLARLISPHDFGLFAMVTALTGFVTLIKDAGLSMATVQRSEVTHEQVSTLFWVNVLIGVMLTILVIVLAPGIAWFYGEPVLMQVSFAIAGTLFLGSLTIQHMALLKRQMKFSSIGIRDQGSKAIGLAVGILMAWYEAGLWALVGMTIATSIAEVVLTWSAIRWVPGPPRRGVGVRSMLAFGGCLSISSLLVYFRRNFDNVMIGFLFGPVTLGLYQKAYSLLLLPIQQANSPIGNVAVPALSRLQDDPERYRQAFRKSLTLLVAVSLPIAGFAFLQAHNIIEVVLGDEWLEAVPIFLALVPAGFASALNGVSSWVFISMGRSNRQLRAQFIATILIVCGLLAGLNWGPIGVAWGFSCSYSFSVPLCLFLARLDTPLTLNDFLVSIRAGVTSTAAAVVAGMALSTLVSPETYPVVQLIIMGATFAIVYAATFSLFPDRAILAVILDRVFQKVAKVKK